MSLIRTMIGLVSLAYYVRHYLDRQLFFGPGGVLGFSALQEQTRAMGTFNLFALSPSAWYFELLFHLGMVTSLALLLGVGGRWALAAHYISLWSLYMTNPSFMDGGDALVLAFIPFLFLTQCYSRFAVTLWHKREPRPTKHLWKIAAHNTGVLLIAAQICIVYMMAGLFKVQGPLWQDGTALYYILRVPEFFWPGVTPMLFAHDWLLVMGAYAVVLSSIYFPLLVLFRRGRPVAVLAMIGFHLAIALFMGLTSFALIMAAADSVFVARHVRIARFRIWVRLRRFQVGFKSLQLPGNPTGP